MLHFIMAPIMKENYPLFRTQNRKNTRIELSDTLVESNETRLP